MDSIVHITPRVDGYAADRQPNLFESTPYVHIAIVRNLMLQLDSAIRKINGEQGIRTSDIQTAFEEANQIINSY